ncbi:hypothetical protein ABVT39_013647 [Epinephelus coioides]
MVPRCGHYPIHINPYFQDQKPIDLYITYTASYSAKYSTYSFQDDATKEILHFELVQVTEATSSVAMEVMGFQRGLKELLDCGVDVAVMTMDRSPSIRKLLREEFPEIRHEFDPWHVVNGSLEVYHSVVLKYAPKRIHFHYDSMRAWTQLAIMDPNENVGRPQATTKEGKTTQTFRLDLMERVLRMRDDPSVVFTMPQREKSSKRKRLLQNIATVPRPEKSVLVARRTSRFGRSFRAAPY